MYTGPLTCNLIAVKDFDPSRSAGIYNSAMLWQKWFNPLSHNPDFYRWKKAMEDTARKGENAGNQHFLLFPQFFFYSNKDKKIIILASF